MSDTPPVPTLGNELVLAQAPTMGLPTPAEWESLSQLATTLAASELVPKALQHKPADITVIVLAARGLGIDAIQALNKIHVIDGKPSMSAELMLALVLRAGHSLDIVTTDNTRCEVKARRRGSDTWTTFAFTWEDAVRAQLPDSKLKTRWVNNAKSKIPESGVWYEYPAAMIRARAISMACRAVFPDVLMGVSYVPEEIGADVDPFTGEPDGTVERIDAETVERLLARIYALSESYRNQLRDVCRERGWNVKAPLPVKHLADFEAELAGLETWDHRRKHDTPPDDDTPAEGQVVGGPPDGPESTDETPDAEVVTDPETGREAPTGPESETVATIRREKVAELHEALAVIPNDVIPPELAARVVAIDADTIPVQDLVALVADVHRLAPVVREQVACS